jgi:hypothetical protein
MPNHIKAAINDDKVRELTDDALYFRLEFIDKSETSKGVKSSGTRFESVEDGWMPFIASLPEDGTFDKQKLAQLGMEKIREALENAAG